MDGGGGAEVSGSSLMDKQEENIQALTVTNEGEQKRNLSCDYKSMQHTSLSALAGFASLVNTLTCHKDKQITTLFFLKLSFSTFHILVSSKSGCLVKMECNSVTIAVFFNIHGLIYNEITFNRAAT